MNKVSRFAVTGAVAALLASAGSAWAADASAPAPKPQVSQASAKDLQAAQKALAAKSYDEVLKDLEKVKANPKKNEYDEFVMNEFYFSAYAGLKNYKDALEPLEAAMASKYMGADELKQRRAQAATLEYQLQNYDKAVEYGNLAIQDGDTSEQVQQVVAQSYYLKTDYPNTDRFARTIVDSQIKAGQAPSEGMLELGLSATAKLKDEPGETRWLELLAAYHPSQDHWENLLDSMYHFKLTDRQSLQLYRLMAEVGVLKHGDACSEMAQLSLDAGLPGEAVVTLNKCFEANLFTDPVEKNRNTHLLEQAKKVAASDQPTLAKSEVSAAGAATGDALVGVGIGYFAYGEYDKAAKDIAAGLAKGMSKDSSDARLLLGIAQYRTGDKAAATDTFKSVKGDAAYQRLAALWILRAKT